MYSSILICCDITLLDHGMVAGLACIVGMAGDLPRKAVGDITPSLTATMMVMPVSRKGTEKSMTLFLSGVILSEVMARSAFPSIRLRTRPCHSPVSKQ